MDNASKALIMAGAILLAVAIVGLGVYLFSLSQGLIDTAESSLNGLSKDLQNNELLKYEGEITGAQARQLINKYNYLKDEWPVTLTCNMTSTSGIKSGNHYNVSFTYSSGFVNKITIAKKTT